jgi:hypothetical protein
VLTVAVFRCIGSFHILTPFRWKVGDVIHDVRCVAVDFRDGINYVELSNRKADSVPPSAIVADPSHLPPGSVVSAIITSISHSAAHNGGLWVQLCPGIAGFVPALEASIDPDVLNDLQSHFIVGSRIPVCVMDKKSSAKVPKAHRMNDQQSDHVVELSILLASSQGTSKACKPQKGDVVVGCISKKTRMQGPPSLMLTLRGGFVGRCCITELADVEEWVNMPLGKTLSFSQSKESGKVKQDRRIVSDSDDHDNEEEDADVSNR